MTRLLKTPIIGPSVAIVDSSWIDIEAGLVTNGMRRMPPDVSAAAVPAALVASSSAAAKFVRVRRIAILPITSPYRHPGEFETTLFVEPGVFPAVAAKDAVHFQRDVLDVGLPAGRYPAVGNDWPGEIFGQLALDRPKNLPATFLVGGVRLLLEEFVDRLIAIAVPVEACTTSVEQIDGFRRAGLEVEADGEFLAHDFR